MIAAALAASAGAQQLPLYTLNGDSGGDRFGNAVASAGDVNRDGFEDVVVGAPRDADNGVNAGKVLVISGQDGSTLYTFLGQAGYQFGFSVAGAGDANGDGYDDVVVGAPYHDGNGALAGAAIVLSGFDGSVLFNTLGAAGSTMGWSVSGAGDVNNDGYDDIVAGAPLSDLSGVNAGIARVVSGVDGSSLYTFQGTTDGDQLGRAVGMAGDVDGDCYADVIVGAPQAATGTGEAQVFSGQTGASLYTWTPGAAGVNYGWSVTGIGDVTGDGVVDLMIGAPLDSTSALNAGAAEFRSGADGSVFRTLTGIAAEDWFGWAVANAGDLNGDGVNDQIIGAPTNDNAGDNSGLVQVYSGSDAKLLAMYEGSGVGSRLGISVASAGDVNGDGFRDTVAGGPLANGNTGEVFVFARKPYDSVAQDSEQSQGQSTNAQFGVRMKRCGDVNNDGVEDIIVGAPFDFSKFGSASVISGADQTLIRKHVGTGFDSWWGIRVGGVGDVDSDGFDDYAIGAWHDDTAGTDAGLARVFSGQTGGVLYELLGAQPADHLGSCFDSLGDVNGDLVDDFLVGVGKGNGDIGFVDIRSGDDGSILYSVGGTLVGEWFGWSGAACGDVDKDGITDFIVGAMSGQTTPAGNGYAQVFSGVDGSVIHTFNGLNPSDRFGWIVNGAGDVNGDGVPDLIVGADGYDGPLGTMSAAGMARVFSGEDGSMLYHLEGEAQGDGFSLGLDTAGDVNGDGYDDFLVGAPNFDPTGLSNAGRAYLYSGFDGSILQTIEGETDDDELGRGVMGTLVDSNSDGYLDIVIGLPKDDLAGTDYGAIRYFNSVVRDGPAYFSLYGDACAGSNGELPRMTFGARPAIGETFDLGLSSAPVSASATLGIDVSQSALDLTTFGAPGCTIWALPVIGAPLLTDATGKVNLAGLAVPNDTQFIGATLYSQWIILDAAANAMGLVTTKGVCINIGDAY